MNLFFKSYKFYIFFFLVYSFKPLVLYGITPDKEISLTPEIIRFEIPVEFNKTPNVSFCRTDEGINFIGKHNGILVVDDDKVLCHPMDHPVGLTRLKNNRIVYLTDSDFGYVNYHPLRGISLSSLINEISVLHQNFIPNNVVSIDNTAFLATSEGVFTITRNSVNRYFFNLCACALFNSGKNIYLQVASKGIFLWDNYDFTLVIPEDALGNEPINSITDWQDGILISSDNQILFFQHDPDIAEYKKMNTNGIYPGIKKVWKISGEYCLCQGNDDQLYFCSSNKASYKIFSHSGIIPKGDLKSVFVDSFNDLWLLFDFNILKIEFPSSANTLDLSQHITGTILSVSINDQAIYLGTNEGLYYMDPFNDEKFRIKKISNFFREYIHLLTSKGDHFFGAGNKAIYRIVDDQLFKIDDGDFSSLYALSESRLVACNDSGLVLYSRENGQWSAKAIDRSVNQVNAAVNYMKKLWLLTQNESVFSFDTSGQYMVISLKPIPGSDVSKLIHYEDLLYILSKNQVLKFDPGNNTFNIQDDVLFKKELLSYELLNSGNNLWAAKKDIHGCFSLWKFEDHVLDAPFYEISAAKRFGQLIDIDETNEYIWITGNRKMIRLNKQVPSAGSGKLLRFRSVKLIDSPGTEITNGQQLPYRSNNITIHLADVRHQTNPYPYYRYKITHYQDEWSDWSRNKTLLFNDLWERDYVFEAQSVSAFGILSEPIKISFTILPPFYRRWYAYLFYSIFLLATAFFVYKWRLLQIKKVQFKLEQRIKLRLEAILLEKAKSDKLVADLFPKGTAEELKSSGKAKSKKFEMVSVLFSDIQGFTRIAEEMNPEVLIDELDKFFFHFDSVVEKYNIEKIKTIGDAYMAAGGIPVKNSSNPVEVVLAGLEMQDYMQELKKTKSDIWDLRIGIHTGPVISGVVGHKKLSYDIWGDTVNTASRMESSGEGGKVNISGTTYNLVKDYFICKYRGKLPVKYKGNIDMYFVTGLRPELAVDLHGIPNKRFFTKLQMLRLIDLQEMVFEKIYGEKELNLHFHKKEFILKMVNQAELLGRSENIQEEDLLIVQTAAMLLFSGITENYNNFENQSVIYARELLPEYNYTEKQVERVCNLILSTKTPNEPQNILEKILIDSKMEFLGRADYITQVKLLYLELKNVNKDFSREKLIKQQKQLLHDFSFHTMAAQRLREVNAEDQLVNLSTWK
ncbi:MAG: adenylate/guanylate cyclase domain-containing protein [Bacteroidales bacterium]|nr:adenylate/guanylate cyclase domain-containing protein [Bacteroidales bacterium]